MSADLIAWLRGVLDDEERAAREAAHAVADRHYPPALVAEDSRYAERASHWSAAHWKFAARVWAEPAQGEMRPNGPYVVDSVNQPVAEHIARHDPASVLADIAAKRAILDLHGIVWRDIVWLEDGDERTDELPVCIHCVPKHSAFPSRQDVPEGPCRTVRLLASAYADQPGYQPEWRPA